MDDSVMNKYTKKMVSNWVGGNPGPQGLPPTNNSLLVTNVGGYHSSNNSHVTTNVG